ncbi:MAG: hypothetical protein L3K17_01420 [Thermoplasmata archaeon]|nr:hypothetical protein [Thermoplasmata archaeon]
MNCDGCGAEHAEGAATCASCGRSLLPPPPGSPGPDPIDGLARDVKAAAKELIVASAKLSKSLAHHAAKAAEDPKGTTKKVAKKVATDLEKAGQEIERALRDL